MSRATLEPVTMPSTAHTRQQLASAVLWISIALGVVLRSATLATREAFWSDEAALALNIVDRAWHEVGRPFSHAQVAPYLFVIGQKLVTSIAGTSEMSLRAWSWLAGVALLPAVYVLARQLSDVRAGLFALATAATSVPLVYYSTELKPYSTDALISTLLALATLHALFARDRAARRRALWQLGIAGVVAPWLSLPAAFVLAGSGLTLGLATLFERRDAASAAQWAILAAIGCCWIASVALHYASFLQLNPSDAAFMQRYWVELDGFAPFPLQSLHDLRWYVGKLFYLFAVLVTSEGYGRRYVAAALWVFGVWLLWRRHRALPALVLAPIGLMLAASAAHAYVVVDRLLLFLTPFVLVPCAVALSRLASFRTPVSNVAAAAVIVALAGEHALRVVDELRSPPPPSDIRSLVGYLRERMDARDRVCVEDRVAWTYEYYAHRAGVWQPFEVITLLETDAVRARTALETMSKLAGSPRVWAVVPTLGPNGPRHSAGTTAIVAAEHRMRSALGALGRQLAMYDATNVRLYLYDLSASAL